MFRWLSSLIDCGLLKAKPINWQCGSPKESVNDQQMSESEWTDKWRKVFRSSHHGAVEPWGCGFDPWPRSVGWRSGIAVSRGVGHRHNSDPHLLWLWPAAVAPIRPLVWEPPYATGAALKSKKKKKKKKKCVVWEFLLWLSRLIWLVCMKILVWSLALLSGLRIWHCHKLRHRSQMRLRSGFAVAVVWADSHSSDSTPSLGASICHGCGPKKTKEKECVAWSSQVA